MTASDEAELNRRGYAIAAVPKLVKALEKLLTEHKKFVGAIGDVLDLPVIEEAERALAAATTPEDS
jgi:hypothetical protein